MKPIVKYAIVSLLGFAAVTLGALVFVSEFNPFNDSTNPLTGKSRFTEDLEAAARAIRRAEQRSASDPAFKAALLADPCQPTFSPDRPPCLLRDTKDILTVAATVGFLRPAGWYLFKRIGDAAPAIQEPPNEVFQRAVQTGDRVSLGGGWWVEHFYD